MFDTFTAENRLTGLIGPRGTGKTTLLLQHINERIPNKESCLYVSLDHIYFTETRLYDFVTELYETQGIRILFLDEVHTYPSWSRELKNIYDSFPDMHVVFSGSSSIDLVHGTHDLSRRGVIYRLKGLSFREYLLFRGGAAPEPISLDSLVTDKAPIQNTVGAIEKLRGHFQDYLEVGYYPFFLEGKDSYNQKLLRIIDKTIYQDIARYYNLKTENLGCFKRLLAYISSIPPGNLSINSISKHIGLDNKTVRHYLDILADTGLATLVGSGKTGSGTLKQTEKVYLENPNLYFILSEQLGKGVSAGSMREAFFLRMLNNAGLAVFHGGPGDFIVDDRIFEIGGKNKDLRQIKDHLEDGYLVKDGILHGGRHEIPLHLFGFLY